MTWPLSQATALCVLLVCVGPHERTLADEKKNGDQLGPASSVASDSATGPLNPDHLEPIAAYDLDGYDQAVYRSLLGQKKTRLWMIEKRSFATEQAVMLLHEEKTAGDTLASVLISEKWIIEHAPHGRKSGVGNTWWMAACISTSRTPTT